MYMYQCELYNYSEQVRKRKILAMLVLKDALTRQKRFHVSDIYLNRRQQGFCHNLIQEMRLGDREQYFNFHRMSVQKFDALLNLDAPSLTKSTLLREDVISPAERLSITLRYLASGDSMASLSYAFRASRSSISNIVKETCDVLWEVLASKVLKQPTELDWLVIAERFFTRWNFPNCIGAIDGKHVVIQVPNNAGSLYYNYKGDPSLVLLAICDADYCLTLVDIGASGRQ